MVITLTRQSNLPLHCGCGSILVQVYYFSQRVRGLKWPVSVREKQEELKVEPIHVVTEFVRNYDTTYRWAAVTSNVVQCLK